MKKLDKIYRMMVCVLPVVLFFSYYPVIRLSRGEAMDFELSLPLIFIVLFDLVGLVEMWRRKLLFGGFKKWWMWLTLPIYLTLTVLWSANSIRGLLTAGMMWVIAFGIYALVRLKELWTEKPRILLEKMFWGGALVVCVWCVMQCVMDLAGVPRECSLMCAGCTYQSFGFPHPNGFAVEPQFMGNLLLAPIVVAGWLLLRSWKRPVEEKTHAKGTAPQKSLIVFSPKIYATLLFIFVATLFLTFSRGAIYAFIVAMIFLTMAWRPGRITREVDSGAKQGVWFRIKRFRAPIAMWLIIILAFVFTLNLQGIMAAVSSTNDTYQSGVAKVLNHLSLGVIDIRGNREKSGETPVVETGDLPVENSVDNLVEKSVEKLDKNADYDGYVEESTAVRMQLSKVAIELWSKDFRTMMFGVGLGGAGQALFNHGLIDWPKEIVQNEYVSLLLETGLVGIMFVILVLVLAIRLLLKTSFGGEILSLMVAYGISLVFFAGLPNALQIYLMPVLVMLMSQNGVRIRSGRN